MFFLPLPLNKTIETLGEVGSLNDTSTSSSTNEETLPSPELYIIVNGKVTKSKVIWRSIVDVSALRVALRTLKSVNAFYKNVSDASIDEATKAVVETVDSTTSSMLVKATKEDVASFEKFTIRTLNQKHSTSSDTEQFKLLDVKENALDSRQKFLDVLCFLHLFPSGKFGEFHPRQVKISSSEYAKSRLLNNDPRFRKDAQYVFFLLWQKELRELSAGIYNLLKTTGQHAMPVDHFLDKASKFDEGIEANLSTIFASIRGSKQYWYLCNSEVRCMVREWGSPVLFLTFSCAEYHCPDITNYLRKVNSVSDSYPIGKLCVEDPISVSRKFSQKFHEFFNTVIIKGKVLGTVSHFFFKKEYQARGAPHYHVVLWVQDAPIIEQDSEEKVLRWIQERITCRIPDEATNPELHQLVTRYQMHRCSAYCKRTKKFNGAYITRCKFGFPRDETDTAILNNVDTCLKGRKKLYCLPRGPQEVRVNDYNPLLLLLWKANIDIQFIGESSLALAHYVTGYVTKAERSNMQDVWQEVTSNKSVYSRLWSFGIRSLRSRECGLYEASDLLLGDHLCEKSETIKWIDASFPHKRKRRLRNHTQLLQLQRTNPNSTDVFEDNLIDTFYPQRPTDLEEVCLYDFVRFYDKCGKDDAGQQKNCRLSKPCLPNHRLYDPNKEGQRDDYFYSLVLLFVPFRNEANLIGEAETTEEAFNRMLSDNSNLVAHHEKLQKILAANNTMAEINKARENEAKVDTRHDNDSQHDTGPQIAGEARDTMKDVHDLHIHVNEQFSLGERVSMLNHDQGRIFKRVTQHLHHQQQHETGNCKCTALQSLHMFISGVGGTGKSFLIQTIRAKVAEIIWKDKSNVFTCAVAAPTGLAAFNVGGVTVHRLFQLPIEHEGKTAQYWPLPKESQKVMRATFRDLKLVIIDEVSMLSSLNLAYLHLRLDEVFGGEGWFGSMNILFVGDLLQLPPVNGAPVFAQLNTKAILTRLGCMTSVNIWEETVVYDELTINERQKTDAQFCAVLDEVRRGCPSVDTTETLQGRLIQGSLVDKFQELQGLGRSPVCLFPTRKACDAFNSQMLSTLSAETIKIPCTDEVDETAGTRKWNQKAAEELQRLNCDCNMTAGLEAVLHVAVGARVMLRRNIDTARGLVNGAVGTITTISTRCVTVKFDQNGATCDIAKVKSKFQVMKRFYVYRKQFPLILAYAITIHKCQGLSLDCAIVDLSEEVFSPGMAYVALSRVRKLSGLHLIAFDSKSVMVSSKCLHEVNRLRQLFTKHLPLYDVPVAQPGSRKRKLRGSCSIDEPTPKRRLGNKPRSSAANDNKEAQKTDKPRKRSAQTNSEPPPKKRCPPNPPQEGNPPNPPREGNPPNPPQEGNRPGSTSEISDHHQYAQDTIHRAFPGGTATILHRLSTQRRGTVEEFFHQHASTLDTIANALNCFPIPYAASLPHLSADTFAASNCHPLLLHTLQPVQTTGDGSCAFNAMSLCLTGSQQYSLLLRLLCAHALVKYKPEMLQALINTWFSTSPHPIPRAERKFYSALRKALVRFEWGGEEHFLSLSWLLNRPIFQYNTFYEGTHLVLADTVNPAHLAQRFLNYAPGTRTHMLYCSTALDSVLRLGDISALPKPPLALYSIAYSHWVACIYHSPAVVTQIPIPRTRIIRESSTLTTTLQ